jgi:hypothetical protein
MFSGWSIGRVLFGLAVLFALAVYAFVLVRCCQ